MSNVDMKSLDAMDEITKNLQQAESILLLVEEQISEQVVSDSIWAVRDLINRTKNAVNTIWEEVGKNESE
ncbi:iduronate-2-sulfatase [Bisgaard Taxon 10/6]|uniref:iduronate-2-sulfatase n=1 Tax=Exercitatus varius TaxID=67857 RepID=UPI00294AEE67|nr:iduronate-2-sulfatase [Exercitatus varius]MDG2917841.1 iduronate-2-sulfatase [Exercitatus varius]